MFKTTVLWVALAGTTAASAWLWIQWRAEREINQQLLARVAAQAHQPAPAPKPAPVAASAPQWVSTEDIPAEVVAGKRAELTAQAHNTGKPPAIVEKMIEGRMRKFYEEVVLGLQPFVLNPDQRVESVLKQAEEAAGATIAIKAFVRFRTGEGIEKGEESRDTLNTGRTRH